MSSCEGVDILIINCIRHEVEMPRKCFMYTLVCTIDYVKKHTLNACMLFCLFSLYRNQYQLPIKTDMKPSLSLCSVVIIIA